MPMGSAIPRPLRFVLALVLLPFPILLVLVWMSQAEMVMAFQSYAALVLALLGGAHWLIATGPYGRARIAAEGFSAVAALIVAWVALLVPTDFGLMILIAAYLLLILRDTLRAEATGLPDWFATLRAYVAAGAVVTAILTLIRVFS